MSSQLAIGAVSAVLRDLLDNGMIDAGPAVGAVHVSAVAPDTIKLDDPTEGTSLNLFLYRVSPNLGWFSSGLPAYDSNGTRTSNSPLALNLHFLLTAYGRSDFQAEILLGYAMSLLHEHQVLDRGSIRKALDPSPLGPSILPPAIQALAAAADLADQIEAVTVTLEPMDTEEMSRLWSAIQAHYRPTAAYVVSVVLIEANKQARTGLPVLTRRGFVQPDLQPPLPTVLKIEPPASQPAARLGETVHISGVHLDGTAVKVSFGHRMLDAPNVITIGVNAGSDGIDVPLPSGPAADQNWPAGVWTVTVELIRPGETQVRSTNVAAMILAPQPVLPPAQALTRSPATGHVSVTIDVHPQVRPGQQASLSLDTATAPAEPHPAATGTLTFKFGDIPVGDSWVRLTVDGAESPLAVRTKEPPEFDPAQKVTVPA
jgi:hypothetical protein